MTHPWPEEESRDAAFGGIFDEAMKPPITGQALEDRLLVAARALREAGQPVPDRLLQLERIIAGEPIMSGASSCPAYKMGAGGVEQLIEHWRACVTCLAAFLEGRLTAEHAEAWLERYDLRLPQEPIEALGRSEAVG